MVEVDDQVDGLSSGERQLLATERSRCTHLVAMGYSIQLHCVCATKLTIRLHGKYTFEDIPSLSVRYGLKPGADLMATHPKRMNISVSPSQRTQCPASPERKMRVRQS